jgi:DNA-binding MarR family transcriptional regulator/N-acetylglutamate synthase-like GNAT family acetyltransferase
MRRSVLVDVVAEWGPVFLGGRFKRLAERLQGSAATIIAEAGIALQPGHMPVMAALDTGAKTVGRLAEETGTSQPGVTRTLGQLVKLGMVSRVAGADQRERLASLTPAGQAAMAQTRQLVWPRIGTVIDQMLGLIAPAPLLDQIAALEAALAERSLALRAADVPSARFVIHEYSDDLAPTFYAINAEWISSMFTLEQTDLDVLENPRQAIIEPGGAILFVEAPGLGIVGTCALQQTSPGKFELTKMGVSSAARGLKAGEFLLSAMIERAQAMHAQQLYLLTNHKCVAAIHLYEKAGFRHDAGILAQYGSRYERCDVAMSFPLTN